MEGLFKIPTLCLGKIVDQKIKKTLKKELKKYDWNRGTRTIISEIRAELVSYRTTFDEIPLGGYLKEEGLELSMCPFCLRTITPGLGLHFFVGPTAVDPASTQKFKAYWIKNRRMFDSREMHETRRFARLQIANLVEDVTNLNDFMELWHKKYQALVTEKLPEMYARVGILTSSINAFRATKLFELIHWY